MGLLDRTSIIWGLGVAIVLGLVSPWVAPLLGLDGASLFIGVVIGLVVAVGYLLVRVLEPVERGIAGLNDGTLANDHPWHSSASSYWRMPEQAGHW